MKAWKMEGQNGGKRVINCNSSLFVSLDTISFSERRNMWEVSISS